MRAAIDFSIVDYDEPEIVYDIQVISGASRGGGAHESETIEVQGDTPAGRIDDVRYGGGNESALLRDRQFRQDWSEDFAWTAPVWFEPGGGALFRRVVACAADQGAELRLQGAEARRWRPHAGFPSQ
jgi:hypothetical protein